MEYGLHARGVSFNCCSTSALANSIALAGIFSLNGPFGSGSVREFEDDDKVTGLKYLRILVAMFKPHVFQSTGSCEIKFTDIKTLTGKIWRIEDQFAKFANVFHRQRFALYGNVNYTLALTSG